MTLDNTGRQIKKYNCMDFIFHKRKVQLNSVSTEEWAKKGEQNQAENGKNTVFKNLSLKFP